MIGIDFKSKFGGGGVGDMDLHIRRECVMRTTRILTE